MGIVKVNIKNHPNDRTVPVGTRLLVRKACIATMTEEGYSENAEVDVSFVNGEEAYVCTKRESPNVTYKTDTVTNRKILGEIVIPIDCILKTVEPSDENFRQIVMYLTVNAMLELLGYDVSDDSPFIKEKKKSILYSLGILDINRVKHQVKIFNR